MPESNSGNRNDVNMIAVLGAVLLQTGRINEAERALRRILSYCGLPWEDACLDFHKSDRQVTTASSEQVRQPIYKGAMGFWKNYEGHLAELIEDLAAVLNEEKTTPHS